LNFIHRQYSFEDFNHEPLLPHRFSKNGPYLATGDVDGNGLEDVWIGGPAKVPGKLLLQQANGKFHWQKHARLRLRGYGRRFV
jgi:hypothetical protein